MPRDPRLFDRLLIGMYRLALEALPPWFRRQWAADMRATFRDRLREAHRAGGPLVATTVAGREIGSIAVAALRSRVEQASGRVHRAHDAQDGSDVWRTDPGPALFLDDRRRLKIASIGALICHFVLFAVVLPEGNTTPVDPEIQILTPVQLVAPPLPPAAATEPPRSEPSRRRPVRRVPIPEPDIQAAVPVLDSLSERSDEPRVPVETVFEVGLAPALPLPPRERVRAGVEVELPAMLTYVEPRYPELALRARLECTVVLEAVVGKDGEVLDASVTHGCGLGLDAAAVAAVSQWRYTPTLLDGRPVEVMATVTVHFQLRHRLP